MSQTTGDGAIWAVVVTFARPATLDSMLSALGRQTRRPDHILVVDNGSDVEVSRVAAMHGAEYADSGDNIGPAGGNALGMSLLLPRAADGDWLLFIDDDDEPADDSLLQRLETFGKDAAASDPRLAGVGIGGSLYRRQWGVFHRLEDHELTGAVELDVLFGGSLPMYRVDVIREVGAFDEQLFWGFEEAEFGLRLRSLGYRLCAPGPLFLEARRLAGTQGDSGGPRRTPLDKAAWRRYYSVRNSTVLARRYGGPAASTIAGVGGAAKGMLALARGRRPIAEIVLPAKGAADAYRGRLGRRIDPGLNSKVSA
ncbi:glycosyltransferase family 2 protein [Janibacter sp. HTCC2649]|uniref:glycosyltransferase family 2 protein n=1 Tax=Janibacter sp. HTCC2649 TaxID=313589 RepID=UPI0009FC530B|nr:glycosyltransferase [Janibacter sp. HTCC2649]